MHKLAAYRLQLERRKGQRDQLNTSIEELTASISQDKRFLHRCERALAIVKQVGLQTQKQLEYHLAEQVSLVMGAVFDDPYQLKVNFLEKRGKTEADLLFVRRGLEVSPMDSSGGGAIDIAALALRIAYWGMRQDKNIRPVLLLDEPFSRLKGTDANHRALAIIQRLSRDMGLQIIMVSDERVSREDIIASSDRVLHTSQKEAGISYIQELDKEGGV